MNLARSPETMADLARSGLTAAEVLDLLGIENVPPAEIKLPGVRTAYRIPSWTIEGERNCSERWRVEPPIKTKEGTLKYWQRRDSDPHAYIPPLANWKTIAVDPGSPVDICEGEKKSAKACLMGRPTIGIPGVWCGWQKTESGDRLVDPTLTQFVWKGRDVLMIPDSDAWHENKPQILQGFYALAQWLINQGAHVTFLRLPDKDGAKQGLDDWYVHAGNDWQHLWRHLEPIGMGDVRLKKVAAWHQRWTSKQATEEFLKNADASKIDILEAGGVYSVAFSAYNVRFQFSRVTDFRSGVQAELTVRIGTTELQGETRIDLTNDQLRGKLALSLQRKHESLTSLPWKLLLERACAAVLKRHRCGEPVVTLQPAICSNVPFILNPIIYAGHPTLIYAPGGSYKSFLALWCLASTRFEGWRQLELQGPSSGVKEPSGLRAFDRHSRVHRPLSSVPPC